MPPVAPVSRTLSRGVPCRRAFHAAAPACGRGMLPGVPTCSPCSARPGSARPRWRSRSPTGCASAASDPVAVSADALQVYAAWRSSPASPSAEERRRLEHRLVAFLPVDATFSAGRVRPARARRDRRAARTRAPRRSSSAAPACTCAPRSPSSTCARRRRRASARRSRPGSSAAGPGLHAELAARAPGRGRRDRPARPPPHRPRARAARPGRARRPAARRATAVDQRHAPPDAARRR